MRDEEMKKFNDGLDLFYHVQDIRDNMKNDKFNRFMAKVAVVVFTLVTAFIIYLVLQLPFFNR